MLSILSPFLTRYLLQFIRRIALQAIDRWSDVCLLSCILKNSRDASTREGSHLFFVWYLVARWIGHHVAAIILQNDVTERTVEATWTTDGHVLLRAVVWHVAFLLQWMLYTSRHATVRLERRLWLTLTGGVLPGRGHCSFVETSVPTNSSFSCPWKEAEWHPL